VQAAPTPAPQIPPDPYANLASDVAEAIKHGDTPTFTHGVTTVFPYSPDQAYQINCSPLHVTQIRLAPDETTNKDDVKIGDGDRWGTIIGDHTVLVFPKGTNVSITVPGAQVRIPADPKMITNIAISTSKGREYILNPVKIGRPLTQAVEWYYPDDIRAQYAARQAALKAVGQEANQ
jgi:type IV secretory pathway VirB9-like protein